MMKYGMVKVAAGTPQIRVADCQFNTDASIQVMRSAYEMGVQVLVLPELGICGYTCGDLFLQKTLIHEAENAVSTICKLSADMDMITILGAPFLFENKLYNCAVVIHQGKILGVVPKENLPNYSEFYELRHFSPAPKEVHEVALAGQNALFGTDVLFRCREMPEFILGVEICEDLWVPRPPSVRHAIAGATVIANLSAGDETVGKEEYRRNLVIGQSARLVCGYIYADAGYGESTSDMVFAGHNLIAENGSLLDENTPFSQKLVVSEIDLERLSHERLRMTTFPSEKGAHVEVLFSMQEREVALTRKISKMPFVPKDQASRAKRCEMILTMQSTGLMSRIDHVRSKCVVIGISGGLDSCLALLVAVRAMDMLKRPRTDILAVTMPCFGTTARTRSNAEILCEALGVSFQCIDITEAVKQHFIDIGHKEDQFDVTFENSQARERTQVLMDLANRFGGLVLGTGDLSELALGWATYNGDHMSMYGINGSIPKTLVRHLVAYVADTADDARLARTLNDVLDTPVSPELLPPEDDVIAQKTEDIVGPYELHDFFLYYMLRFGFTPSKIFYLAKCAYAGIYEDEVILKWLKIFYRRFFTQQFKRSCLPDGPKVGSVALSPRGDWRMPSDASGAMWLKDLERI